jgi:hypothetical protein
VGGFGSSETSALAIGDGESVTVPGLSIERVMTMAGEGPVFVKIDIEGYEYEIADEIAKLGQFHVKGVHVAVHPQLYAKTLPGLKFLRRFKAAAATRKLAQRLARSFSGFEMTPKSDLWFHLARNIVLRASPKGIDFLFRRAIP